MPPQNALTRDLRLLRRAGAALMAFLLLPWLFISASWSYPHWPVESAAPAVATAAVPSASSLIDVPVQWMPLQNPT